MSLKLTPKTLARVIGVSESSLKRWADNGRLNVIRTPGGHRRIELPEALRFIRDEGLSILDPVPLGLANLAITSRGPSDSQQDETLKAHVLAGDTQSARSMLLSMFMNGRTIASLCDGPLTQAMHRVGTCWLEGPNGIHIEHRSTDLCIELLMYMRTILPSPPATAPLAIGATPELDPYVLPSLMATVVLQSLGWRTINLGSLLPVKSLVAAAQEYQPALVWLSVSVPDAMVQLTTQLPTLVRSIKRTNAVMMAGGQAWQPPAVRIEGLESATNMSELAAFAKGLSLAAK